MDLRVSSPCPKSWDDLVGDRRVRYCGQCRLNVYNLAEMSPEEVERVVLKTEGRLCGRLYDRGDQTATVQNCPRSGFRKKMAALLTVSAVLLLGGLAWGLRSSELVNQSALPSWVRVVLRWFEPDVPVLGAIRCFPPKTPPTPPSTED